MVSAWKFEEKAKAFHQSMEKIIALDTPTEDYIHQYPLFTGTSTIARFLALYDAYQSTLGVNGHIAEVGTFKGASLLYFAKLCEIFEPHAYTHVHGFDWFQGMNPGHQDPDVEAGSYSADYDRLLQLLELQELDHFVHVHQMDVTTDLEPFLASNPGLRFKLVFLDAGIYEVIRTCLPLFWERLNKGGVLVLDHVGDPRVAGETTAVAEMLGDVEIRTFPWSRQPAGYIEKV
ncbi:MAG: hypothetical protein CL569_16300 [Alphaproteobacteria bacterium]|nr:hypothetical protein [Alphaproteobacteria bacterium]|tara:strand:+ start:449 stop:1144 length:696 start_codon:yes stop_codon:yes gene_type:complete